MNLPLPARTPISLAALAGLALCGAARAQTLTWSNPAGGSASIPANWSPAQVPTSINPLLFTLNSAYSVTFNIAAPQSFSMLFSRGVIGLSTSSPHTTGAIVVGNANAASSTVNFTTGTLNSNQVLLGQVSGSAGVFNLSGVDSLLNCTDVSVANNTNLICSLTVAGGAVISADSLALGDLNSAGEGRVTVSGQPRAFPVERSRLDAASGVEVGVAGAGRLTVENGAIVSCGGALDIARRAIGGVPSSGAVTVGGLGTLLPATISVGGVLRVGRGFSDSSNTGVGALTINDDGLVSVAGSTLVGGTGSGSGALTINPGGAFTTHGLSFGPSGAFNFNGGDVTIVNGPFIPADPVMTISGGGAGASLILDGLTNTPTFTAATPTDPALGIGGAGAGSLTLRNGAALNATIGHINIGGAPGAGAGTVIVESGSVLRILDAGQIHIGRDGAGSLTLRSGGRIECPGLLGSPFGGAGSLLAENPGTLITTGAFTVSDGAVFVIRDGARLQSSGGAFTFQMAVRSGGVLTLDGASVEVARDALLEGALNMTQSTLRADHFICAVPLSVSGAILAKIQSSLPITALGDLTLGDDAVDALEGTPLNVGAFRVATMDADDTVLGNTTINGGVLLASDEFVLPAGRTLTGAGTISGDLTNLGSITATGAAGLTFTGKLRGLGQGVSGTKYTFAASGGMVGAGVINSKIVCEAGSHVTISGPSSLGDGSTAGFIGGGQLDVNANLTLNDSNGVGLGSSTVLQSATLTCLSSLTLNAAPVNSILSGAGIVSCPQLNNVGLLTPGHTSGDRTSQLVVAGAYSQTSGALSGELAMDIEGPAASEADLLTVQGVATLAGTLRVSLLPGFQPLNGFARSLVQAGSLVGRFETEILPSRFHSEYAHNQMRVVFCSADFNDDGFVDFFDYDDYVQCFESGLCPPGASADFNEDGFADFFDYDDFVNAFQQGC